MSDQPTELSEAAKAEIAAAVKIVAEDRNSARLRAIHDKLIPPTPETSPPKDGEPTAPPKGDDKQPPADKDKTGGGLWWPSHQLGADQE